MIDREKIDESLFLSLFLSPPLSVVIRSSEYHASKKWRGCRKEEVEGSLRLETGLLRSYSKIDAYNKSPWYKST